MGLCISSLSSSSSSKPGLHTHDFSSTTATTGRTTNSSVERRSQFSEAVSESSVSIVTNSGQLLESPNLKVYTFMELTTATKNFRPDSMLGQGGFGKVYRGWIDAKTLSPSKAGSGMVVAVKRLNSESVQGFAEWREIVQLISGTNLEKKVLFLLRYSLQTAVHSIWRERNSRRQGNEQQTHQQLTRFIDKAIRNRLMSVRAEDESMTSAIQIWFGSRL